MTENETQAMLVVEKIIEIIEEAHERGKFDNKAEAEALIISALAGCSAPSLYESIEDMKTYNKALVMLINHNIDKTMEQVENDNNIS